MRRNVSIHDHDELFRPEPPEDYDELEVELAQLVLRSERQTLLRLPRSEAVLFTIKSQQCPVTVLRHVPTVAVGSRRSTGRCYPNWIRASARPPPCPVGCRTASTPGGLSGPG